MSDWKTLLGWGPDFEQAMAPHEAKGLAPARVCLVYRKQLKVLTDTGERWARTGGRMNYRAHNQGELPAVGDWVAARVPQGDGEALVQTVLPRRTAFVRKVPGHSAVPQVLATNVDVVLVVMGLDEDFNVRRLERYLSLAWESQATPVVVLNKKDLCAEPAARLAEVRAIARDAVVHAVSATQRDGLDSLQGLLGPGRTVALLGSSGVGKSTLINHLVGSEVMATGETRDDGKGRHTTTRRELLVLPGGGAVIDTPGLRELQLWSAQDGVEKTFDDVTALAQGCRFTDCGHVEEPGCAVKQALEDGTLDAQRYESWRALKKELAWLESNARARTGPESRRRERVGHTSRHKKG